MGSGSPFPCGLVLLLVGKPQAQARGIRVASRRCRIGSPGVTCSAPGILLQDARLADWASLVSRKDSRLLRVPPPAPHDRESGGATLGVASRREAPSASAGYTGGIETVPDWFAGSDMLGAGDFATGCPAGRLGVARESQRFPASARATPGSSRSGIGWGNLGCCFSSGSPKRERGVYGWHRDGAGLVRRE